MGMRATVARITKTGKVVCTSVQWSMMIDDRIAQELNATRGNKQAAVRRLFNNITKNNHISCLEVGAEETEYSTYTKVGRVAQVKNAQQDDAVWGKSQRSGTDKQLKAAGITATEFVRNFHFEDGLSVIFDERTPQLLTFGWEDWSSPEGESVKFQQITLEDLAGGKRTKFNDR